MVGIRLDSGDLAYLSIEARKLLDAAGFPQAQIVASNDLDERIIESLKQQGAKITVWGVGTKLATAYDQPALGGVYKLGALADASGQWHPKLKLSEQAVKTTIPGVLQVRRFATDQGLVADMIYDLVRGVDPRLTIVDSRDPTRQRKLPPEATASDLLEPMLRGGRRARPNESLESIRERAAGQVQALHPSIRRFLHPHEYPVGIDLGLHEFRQQQIAAARS
jgi:nicotinate phosphoribosyltransferase